MKKIVDLRELRDFCREHIYLDNISNYENIVRVEELFKWLKQQPDAEQCTDMRGISAEEKTTKVEKKPSYKQLFYEAFPQARKHVQTGTPPFEACHVWPDADFDCDDDCDKCWNQESE